jgi:hypothetical protein
MLYHWHRDYIIKGVDDIDLHHIYRAIEFLGDEIKDQQDKTPFSPRCIKDLLEENLCYEHRDLFTELDFVFFDTTSIYKATSDISN